MSPHCCIYYEQQIKRELKGTHICGCRYNERLKPKTEIDLSGLRSYLSGQVSGLRSGTPWPETLTWPVSFWNRWPESRPVRGDRETPLPACQVFYYEQQVNRELKRIHISGYRSNDSYRLKPKMSKLRENTCHVPFRRWKVLFSTFETGACGSTVFPSRKTNGYTRIWHRRCDKDWLEEGGVTSSSPLSLHLTEFSLSKSWSSYITGTNTYPLYLHFLSSPVCLFN